MDFVTHMPKSKRGNTFSSCSRHVFRTRDVQTNVIHDSPGRSREHVLRMFGASKMIRHDQDPRFTSEVFTRFRELLGSRQRSTLSYRPDANGQQERSVQTVIQSVRAYVPEADQSDDHAERLMFALNASFDATRLDTSFYQAHGCDAQGTVSSTLGPKPSSLQEWIASISDYSYARACAKVLLKETKRMRSEAQT
ncbi:reverse transcriptase [Phytophthora megakarya]|uniref:Reverse transcriptase n=1 Tax=Phytophthora megakarya TaxID=4795 RepID=A0A225WRL4_9STRA|nr:reverse transcriptase [Phytophthora megakarya]OWZ20220.1 reverse transcriptase [Phytophthora megakarya]